MECDDSTTDDDATENEEEKTAVDVTSGILVNEGIETKWYGLVIVYSYKSVEKLLVDKQIPPLHVHSLINNSAPSLPLISVGPPLKQGLGNRPIFLSLLLVFSFKGD